MKKSVEILAPAGSFESMKAAVAAGADAIYIGGSRFGARAFADNPLEDKLLEAIDYVHLHGRKLYLTVNTLMKDSEINQLYDYLNPYYKQGLDAVIVQDLGAFSLIRNAFPDLPIHASTQMTITGAHGARILKELGADRIVTARELSLKEIEKIRDEVDVEIESFVHGALCYCYSGQCLFSSLIGGRSGNRGRCAQTCRLPFEGRQDGKMIGNKGERYCLSLKDLCTLDLIPDIIESGVYSMKIEGRMKSPRYTAGVVDIYRKYTDRYLANGKDGYQVEEKDRKILLDLFDRGGQTTGYYDKHNGKDMIVWKEKPSFREANQPLFEYLDKNFVENQLKEPVCGNVSFKVGEKAVFTLHSMGHKITVLGEEIQTAQNQPMTEEKVRKQLSKTGNTPFYFKTLTIEIAGDGFLPVQALNELRRQGFLQLETEILSHYHRIRKDQAGFNVPKSTTVKSKRTNKTITVSLERPDCFSTVVKNPDVQRIYLDAAHFNPKQWKSYIDECHKNDKECMLTLPHIFRTHAERFFEKQKDTLKNAGFDGFLIRSLEEIGFLKKNGILGVNVFDFGIYGMNVQAQVTLLTLGADEITWPVELNNHELEKLNKPGELLVYGHLPMMVTAQCLHQSTVQCDKKPVIMMIKDRIGKEFPVKNHCLFCYNSIYNTAPLSLHGQKKEIDRLSPASVRLQFTIEDPMQTDAVITSFADELIRGKEVVLPYKEFTRGHFKRGIE